MRLSSDVYIDMNKFIMVMDDLKAERVYYLISPYHKEERSKVLLGATPAMKWLEGHTYLSTVADLEPYVVAAIKQSKVTGKVTVSGNHSLFSTILAAIHKALAYQFPEQSVITNDKTMGMGKETKVFYAVDANVTLYYETENGIYQNFQVETSGVKFKLEQLVKPIKLDKKRLEFAAAPVTLTKQTQLASLKTLDYPMLRQMLDMSWYEDETGKKKDYSSVSSIRDFELKVMTPLIKRIAKASKEDPADVALDTETTGVNVYDLSPDNPLLSTAVSWQVSWEDNQGVAVFTDMEHFDNVPNQYVADRLAELFFEPEEDGSNDVFTVKYWEEGPRVPEVNPVVQDVTSFGWDDIPSVPVTTNAELQDLTVKTATLRRSAISLDGWNFPFDRRVGLLYGRSLWFDDDGLQMSFDINPNVVRNNNKLKMVTRRVYGHETPELSDVLGKGNEDKFRYLEDRQVAEIYGCADTDYTRMLVRYLRTLMSPQLYARYKIQDPRLLNILANSEFTGLPTLFDQVVALAKTSEQNIERLKQLSYNYVGTYIKYAADSIGLKKQFESGLLTEEQYKTAIANLKPDTSAVYEFEFKASSLREVMYDILKYPILGWTEGKNSLPKVDKVVVKKLIKVKLEADSGRHMQKLSEDVISCDITREEYNELKNGSEKQKKKAERFCLVNADEFNQCKYPLALVIQKYSELNKEYTSYFKPILHDNFEGKIFKSYSMARIETRRIQNPAQTMKGSLKALVRSYNDDYYMMGWDMSQVEYRIWLSLSKHLHLIKKMMDPESDYHTENAAMINNCEPYRVSKAQRKAAKPVSFGSIYGLGIASLAEKLFGVVNSETKFKAALIFNQFKSVNACGFEFLDKGREQGCTEIQLDDELRDFLDLWKKDEKGNYEVDEYGKKIPRKVSFVFNELGFHRMFYVENIDQSDSAKERRREGVSFTNEESKIRRPAGNYLIQSYAAELFRIALMGFYKGCKKYGIADKVKWHMLVHDELQCSVHKSVNPFLMYKIIREFCMVKIPGHTNYYIGINVGNTWGETHDDAREAPIHFVDRMIKRYDAGEWDGQDWFPDAWAFVKPYLEQYKKERVYEVVKELQPNVDSAPIDVQLLLDTFSNYTVRAYVYEFDSNHKPTFKPEKGNMDQELYLEDLKWQGCLETWAIEYFGEGKLMTTVDRGTISLKRKEEEIIIPSTTLDDLIDYDELFEKDFDDGSDDNWSFDEEGISIVYEADVIEEAEEEDYKIDFSKKDARSLGEMIVQESKYKHFRLLNNQIVINVKSQAEMQRVQAILLKYKAVHGYATVFKLPGDTKRWLTVKNNVNLEELDVELGVCLNMLNIDNKTFKHLAVLNGKLIITLKSLNEMSKLSSILERYEGVDVNIIYKLPGGDVRPGGAIRGSVKLEKLDQLIESWRK